MKFVNLENTKKIPEEFILSLIQNNCEVKLDKNTCKGVFAPILSDVLTYPTLN